MPDFVIKIFAALIASLAAPFCGGIISCFAGTFVDVTIDGLFSMGLAILIGIIPSAIGAVLQAPIPFAFPLFFLFGLPQFMLLSRSRGLGNGTVAVIGLMMGLVLICFLEYFPLDAPNYFPFVPREHALLPVLWALLTGVSGSFAMWYIGFDSRES